MEDGKKIEALSALINGSKSFGGYSLEKYTQEELDKVWSKNDPRFDHSFLTIQEKDKIYYLPKTPVAKKLLEDERNSRPKSNLDDMVDAAVDIYGPNFRSYEAKGLVMKNVSESDVSLLKETFGLMISCSKKSDTDKDYEATLFTQLEKKSGLEKTVDRAFGSLGVATAVPAAAAAAVTGAIFSNPLTGIGFLAQGGVALGTTIVVGGLSAAVNSIPHAIKYVDDKLHGDEKDVALNFVKQKFTSNQEVKIDYESEVKIEKINVVKNMKSIREAAMKPVESNANKLKV